MIYQRGMLVFVVLVAAERPRCATCFASMRAEESVTFTLRLRPNHHARIGVSLCEQRKRWQTW
jgi:hypothetical protein